MQIAQVKLLGLSSVFYLFSYKFCEEVMSALAKSFFLASCACAGGTIYYVHWRQVADRVSLHEGVVRELERQERKKENLEQLQTQIEITKQYQEVMARKEKEMGQ